MKNKKKKRTEKKRKGNENEKKKKREKKRQWKEKEKEKKHKKEQGKENISDYIITEDMHERKKVMYMNSDMIIALPGGIGTLEELFEMITWKQLGLHDKPIYLLNILGYWDNLIHSFNQIIKDGFLEKEATNYFKICESVDAIFFDLKKEGLIESYE